MDLKEIYKITLLIKDKNSKGICIANNGCNEWILLKNISNEENNSFKMIYLRKF